MPSWPTPIAVSWPRGHGGRRHRCAPPPAKCGGWRARSPPVGDDLPRRLAIPGEKQRVGTLVVVEPLRHADDDALAVADIVPAVMQVRRDPDEAGVALAECELVDPAE